MKKKYFISFLLFFNSLIVCAQEPVYFNHIYNPINTYASGRGILQVDSNYYGIFGTWEAPEYYYKLGVFKMDLSGNLINWNILGEDNHDYFAGSVGGTLIKTNEGNFAFVCQVQNPNAAFGKLIKLNPNLDTIWTRSIYTDNYITGAIKVKQTANGGYIIIGRVIPEDGDYYDLLLLRADIQGNKLWYKIYGGEWSENGTDVIETTDGGYLVGGYFWKPGYDHSLDAMLIKTDSLGNEEWTKYYGNPDVDDDMAMVALADDGNYLVATTYGKNIIAPEARTAQPYLIKVDENGNTVWEKSIGPHRLSLFVKNFRKENNEFILTGFSSETDTATFQYYSGWMMKLDNSFDSVWYRDYVHNVNDWDNMFYDAYPTSDKGYIAIGQARPDMGGNNKMWIVKVDSMGCDTPGCFTTIINDEIYTNSRGKMIIWPNPSKDKIMVNLLGLETMDRKEKHITIYNSHGLKVECLNIPAIAKTISINVSEYANGLYFIQYGFSDQIMETVKFIKN